MYFCAPDACKAHGGGGDIRWPGTEFYTQLWVTIIWVTQSGAHRRAASTLSHWALSPVLGPLPSPVLKKCLLKMKLIIIPVLYTTNQVDLCAQTKIHKKFSEAGTMVHMLLSRGRQTCVSLRPAWSTQPVPGCEGYTSEDLFSKIKYNALRHMSL